MGFEYRLAFRPRPDEDLDARLRRLPFFRGFDRAHSSYRFTIEPSSADDDWPDAVAAVEDYGIYLCQYRRHDVILGALTRLAVDVSDGEVTIDEL